MFQGSRLELSQAQFTLFEIELLQSERHLLAKKRIRARALQAPQCLGCLAQLTQLLVGRGHSPFQTWVLALMRQELLQSSLWLPQSAPSLSS
jgi:hypothetical protein